MSMTQTDWAKRYTEKVAAEFAAKHPFAAGHTLYSRTFNKNVNGDWPFQWAGQLVECGYKTALGLPNPDKLSPAGQSDFHFGHHEYDTKQNGTAIKYGDSNYVAGSSRVIYATHICYRVLAEDATTVTLEIDMTATDFWVVNKRSFVTFLIREGFDKNNGKKNQTNMQTLFVYKDGDYHGTKYLRIEEWCRAHALHDEEAEFLQNL